jgi:hypothetical protein
MAPETWTNAFRVLDLRLSRVLPFQTSIKNVLFTSRNVVHTVETIDIPKPIRNHFISFTSSSDYCHILVIIS